MKKRWIFAALVAIFALAMFGCKNEPDDPVTPPPPAQVTITFALQAGISASDLEVDGTAFTLPIPVKINRNTALGNSFPPAWIDYVGTETLFFQGWYNGSSVVSSTTTFSANATLTAKFAATDIRIDISFTVDEEDVGTAHDAAPAAVRILPGTSLGDQFPGAISYTGTDAWLFSGWYDVTTNARASAATIFNTATQLVAKFALGVKVTFWTYYDGSTNQGEISSHVIPEGSNLQDNEISLPATTGDSAVTRTGFEFGKWVLVDQTTEVTETTSFSTDTNVYGLWWSTEFTDTNDVVSEALEKVRLSNGAYVIYEFDLAGASVTGTGPNGDIIVDDLAAISEISLSQAITEAVYNNMSVRGLRIYGPYAYNADDFIVNQGTWSNGDVLHGDFIKTAEGMYLAKMDGSGNYDTAEVRKLNKFHPYMSYNNANRYGVGQGGWNAIPNNVTEITTASNNREIKPDEWFAVKYPMTGTIPSTDANGQSLGQTLFRIKAAGTDVLPYGTNYNKVYFAIGPSTETTTSLITYAIKDVALKIGSVTVNGAIPDFDGDPSTYDQSFAAYEDENRFTLWRGDVGDPIEDAAEGGTKETYEGDNLDGLAPADGGDGFFFLRLGDIDTPPAFNKAAGSTDPAVIVATRSFTGKFTDGPVEATFTGGDEEILSIALTPTQQAILADIATLNALKVTVEGSVNAASNFNIYLGNATLGSGWNISGDIGSSDVQTGFFGEEKAATAGGKGIKHIIFRYRGSANSTLTIDSIKIGYNITPPVPCDCPTAGACLPVLGTHACNGDQPGVLCTCMNPLANLNDISGIQQSGTVKFLLHEGSLIVYDRANDYSTIDLQLFTAADPDQPWRVVVDASKYYRLTVKGRVVADSGYNIKANIAQGGSPYGTRYTSPRITSANKAVTAFTAEIKTFTGADLATPNTRIRVIDDADEGWDADEGEYASGPWQGETTKKTAVNPSFVIDSVELIELSASGGTDVGAALIKFNLD